MSLVYPPTPEYAPMFAVLARETAWQVSGIELDDTSKSLPLVERIVDRFRAQGKTHNDIPGTVFMFGCYVGEIFVREREAAWIEASKTPMRDHAGGVPILIELGTDTFCNPIGKVAKRLDNGDVDSLVYFYEVFAPQAAPRRTSWLKKLWR